MAEKLDDKNAPAVADKSDDDAAVKESASHVIVGTAEDKCVDKLLDENVSSVDDHCRRHFI